MKTIVLLLYLTTFTPLTTFAQHSGTTQGAPTFGAAKFANGLTATSDTNYISLPTGTFFWGPTANWTVEAQLKTAGAATKIAVSSGSFGDTNAMWMGTNASGHFVVSITGTGAFAGGPPLDSTIAINDNAFHHCAASMTGGTSLKLFVDGVLGATFTGQISTPPNDHTSGLIGRFPAGGFSWPGSIDEVAIWTVARYTVNFTPPAAAYVGTETGLYALYHLQSDGTDSSVQATITADDANIVYTGRWAQTGSGGTARATTINAGSYFDVAVNSPSISIVFDETGLNASGFPDIEYQVDGGPPTRVTLSTGAGMTVAVSFPVPALVVHRLRVWAEGVTEGSNPAFNQWTSHAGAVIMQSLTCGPGATTIPTAVSKNSIEFLGDSIVASVRQLSNCGGGSVSNATCMAAHNGWAIQVGQYLGLRAVVTGFGGTGLTVAGSGGVPIANTSFPLIFAGTSYTPANKPQVVVVEDGTNDGGASSGTYQTALTTYLATIRAAYPSAYVFCIGLPSNTHSADMGTVVAATPGGRTFYLDYTALALTTTDGTHLDTGGATTLAAKLGVDIQAQLNASGVALEVPGGGIFITAQ